MKKLRWTGLFGLLILAIIFIVGPIYTHYVVHRQLIADIHQINTHGFYRATYTPTQQNWFSQRGNLKLTPRTQNHHPDSLPPLEIQLQINYGPLPIGLWIRNNFSILAAGAVINAQFPQLNNTLKNSGSQLDFQEIIGLFGTRSIHASLSSGHLSSPEHNNIRWDGGNIQIFENHQRYHGQIDIGYVHAEIHSQKQVPILFTLKPVLIKFKDLKPYPSGYSGTLTGDWRGMDVHGKTPSGQRVDISLGNMHWHLVNHFDQNLIVGDGQLTLDHALVEKQGDIPSTKLSLSDLNVTTHSHKISNLYVDSELALTIKSIDTGEQLSPIILRFSLDHQYIPAIQKITRLLRQLDQEDLKTENLDPKTFDRATLNTLLPAINEWLQHRPSLTLKKLQIGTAEGNLQANGKIWITSKKEPITAQNLLQLLRINWHLTTPHQWVRHFIEHALSTQHIPANEIPELTQNYLVSLNKSGLLISDGKNYRIDGQFANGILKVNGIQVWPQPTHNK